MIKYVAKETEEETEWKIGAVIMSKQTNKYMLKSYYVLMLSPLYIWNPPTMFASSVQFHLFLR